MNLGMRGMVSVTREWGLALLMAGLAMSAYGAQPADPVDEQPPVAMIDPAYGEALYGPEAGNVCGAGCNACGSACGCSNCANQACYDRGFARVEYLMWWSNGRNTPPLVTTSPAGTAQVDAGVIGAPDTTVLFGGDYGEGMRSGGRVTVGRTFGHTGEFSLNGRFFALEDSVSGFFESSAAGDPILARPFFNTTLGQQDALLVAFPGIAENGSVSVQARNDVLGADVYVRNIFWWDECKRIDFLAGYQFTRIDDSLVIDSDTTSVDPLSTNPVGTTFSVMDSFQMQNEFHGGQIGVITEWQRGRAWFELLAKVAIGNMRQRATLSGETVRTEPLGAPVVSDSGLLVQVTNAGDRQRDQFSFIPEIGFTVGYQVNSRLSLTAGYSFIYWNDVLLAGNQIDSQLNLTQNPGPIVGPPAPVFAFSDTDFWVQGLSLGGEFRF